MQGIFCLMLGGIGLTNEGRTLLYRTACEMYQKNLSYVSVKSMEYEGVVRTKLSYGRIGSISGTKFTADLETEQGKSHVDFIVQDWDLQTVLKYGEWYEVLPLPETHPARKAHLN